MCTGIEYYVLICEDSMEGILTGVYEAYQIKKDKGIESHDSIRLAVKEPAMQCFLRSMSIYRQTMRRLQK